MLDRFKIFENGYSVEDSTDAEHGPFIVRQNGCAIASRPTRNEARRTVQSYAVSQLRAEIAGMKDRLALAESALTLLDTNDVFDLAQFRTKS